MSKSFEIAFSLAELQSIIAGEPHLSWFRLTEGLFDLRIGSHSIYGPPAGGVDYYVARLWEDLIRIEPFALEPIPAELANLINNSAEWIRIRADIMERSPGETRPGGALAWWTRRVLDSSYLDDGPRLALTRVDSKIRVVRTAGQETSVVMVDVGQFSEEMSSFDRRLVATMAARLEELAEHQPIPSSAMEELRFDHGRRSQYRSMTLSEHIPTDWPVVLRALEELRVL